MGNIICCGRKRHRQKIVLLLVGLDNAGKTVAAKALAGESKDSVVPTVGFSVVNLTYFDYLIKIFDLGGGPTIRGIWPKYFVDAHGIIFVVDASDFSRLDEARDVFRRLLSHEKVSRKPVLVLANKQDNEDALDEVNIIEQLELEPIVNSNECPTLVETCSATDNPRNLKTDPCIKKGFEWLVSYIIKNYEVLNSRVVEDVLQQVTMETALRLEKIDKMNLLKEAEKRARNDEDAIESYSNYERKLNGTSVAFEKLHNESDSSESLDCAVEKILLERPKSAVQIVRQHLELNASKRKAFISMSSYKTAPLIRYRPPRSATVQRRKVQNPRHLKSAGDAQFRFTELPNVPMNDDHHQEFIDLMRLRKGEGKANGINIE